MFSGGIRVKVVSSGDFTVGERALVVVSLILSSSCYRWRDATPWGLACFHHHSASRIFITQPSYSPPLVVIQKLEAAVQKLDTFMKSQGLDCAPEAVPNLKGDAARAAFIEHFKEVQRLKTQLDQYTDLTPENAAAIEQVLPRDNLLGCVPVRRRDAVP